MCRRWVLLHGTLRRQFLKTPQGWGWHRGAQKALPDELSQPSCCSSWKVLGCPPATISRATSVTSPNVCNRLLAWMQRSTGPSCSRSRSWRYGAGRALCWGAAGFGCLGLECPRSVQGLSLLTGGTDPFPGVSDTQLSTQLHHLLGCIQQQTLWLLFPSVKQSFLSARAQFFV